MRVSSFSRVKFSQFIRPLLDELSNQFPKHEQTQNPSEDEECHLSSVLSLILILTFVAELRQFADYTRARIDVLNCLLGTICKVIHHNAYIM